MGQVISRHNNKVAKQEQVQQPPPGCNCKGGTASFPVDGACLTKGVVYQRGGILQPRKHTLD